MDAGLIVIPKHLRKCITDIFDSHQSLNGSLVGLQVKQNFHGKAKQIKQLSSSGSSGNGNGNGTNNTSVGVGGKAMPAPGRQSLKRRSTEAHSFLTTKREYLWNPNRATAIQPNQNNQNKHVSPPFVDTTTVQTHSTVSPPGVHSETPKRHQVKPLTQAPYLTHIMSCIVTEF